jgi:hypothetical protein
MTTSPPPDFAALLRELRGVRALTQKKLAERAGLSRGAVVTSNADWRSRHTRMPCRCALKRRG